MKKTIERHRRRRGISLALALILAVGLLSGQKAYAASVSKNAVQGEEEYEITLMAIGDNLLHMGIVGTGKRADGTRNYDFLFEGISGLLDAADVKIINQETIFGGNQLGFSGFPKFNSPTEAGDAIAAAGFNVVLQSSNHTALSR